MRKFAALLAVAALVAALVALPASVSASDKTMTWTGWISDSGCGAKGTNAEHKDCAAKCVKQKGASWVFVNSDDNKVYNIHNQDAISEANLGMQVKVTGHTMDDGSIHVDSVAPAMKM